MLFSCFNGQQESSKQSTIQSKDKQSIDAEIRILFLDLFMHK